MLVIVALLGVLLDAPVPVIITIIAIQTFAGLTVAAFYLRAIVFYLRARKHMKIARLRGRLAPSPVLVAMREDSSLAARFHAQQQ